MLSQIEGDEKQKMVKIMAASVVTGIAVAIAPSLIMWLSGIDINDIETTSRTIADDSSGGIPPSLANVLRNGFTVVTVIGAVIAAGGLVLGAIKMQLVSPLPSQRH